jgi:hypothetical protein
VDDDGFDDLSRRLSTAPSRRAVLKGLGGGALAALLAALGVEGAGATHFGCRHVGKRCARHGQCCSGRCQGIPGRKTCRAHHTGTCTLAQNICRTGIGGTCGGGACSCHRTTGGATFCANLNSAICATCTKDKTCEDLGYGRGAACIDTSSNAGICACGGNTACAFRCPTL